MRPHGGRPVGVVVCPVLPFPPVSGTAKRTLRLLETMERADVRPHLVSLHGAGAGGADALRERGWAVDLVPEPKQSLAERLRQHAARRPSPYVPALAARLRELRAQQPAFVQVEHAMAAYYRREHPSRRTLLSLHNVDSQMLASVARGRRPLTPGWARAWNRALAMRAVERREAPRADVVICVSEEDVAHFEQLGARTLLVPNGVDDALFELPAELPAAQRALFFGHLGYAPNAHGLERFLRDGWPRLRAARPAATLRVVGPGTPPAALARLMDARDGVEHVGPVADMAAELVAARLVLVPIWQGGGTRLKALEALAAARPVAGTPLGLAGIGIGAGVHAAVAEQPAELAERAAALLGDAGAARQLAAAGRRLAERFRWARVTAPLEELYARWAAG